MPSPCVAPHCHNSSRQGFSLLTFPKDPLRRQAWLHAVRMTETDLKPGHRVCEVHFKAHDWVKKFSLLKPHTVPSVFCTCSEPSQPSPPANPSCPASDHHYSKTVEGYSIPREVRLDHCYSKLPHFVPKSVPSKASRKKIHNPTCLLSLAVSPQNSIILTRTNQEASTIHKENAQLRSEVVKLNQEVAAAKKKVERGEILINALKEKNSQSEEFWKGKFGHDQVKCAETGNSRGRKWSLDSVKKALRLRFHCGSRGLGTVSEDVFPFPSVRTVQRRTQCIKFLPGVLHEILEPFKKTVTDRFEEFDRDCCLHFDEMTIKARVDYDKGTGSYIGMSTLPGAEGVASKLEVWMFGGIRKRFKLNAAYHFTPQKSSAAGGAGVLKDVLKAGADCGLNTLAIVCDMGNRDVLSSFGFSTTKAAMRYCIPNPVDPTKNLYLVPDIVHLFKSMKEMFVNNEIIVISEDIVKRFNLPSNTVKLCHVECLISAQDNMDVKLSPRLKMKDIESNHFNKMNPAAACHIFSDKTGKAIDFLVDENMFPEEFRTTAWFLNVMNRWFTTATARNLIHALSLKNVEAYQEAIDNFHLVVELFMTLHCGNQWKPVQTHIVVATRALLQLQQHLLIEKQYDFLMLGRFLNDLVENLFSVMRDQRPTPTALEGKYRLKQCTLGQCSRKVKKSQYEHDEGEALVDLEEILRCINSKSATQSSNSGPVFPWIPPSLSFIQREVEGNATYRMCGYLMHSMRSMGQLKCDTCFSNLQHQGEESHPLSQWTDKTDYKKNAQIRICDNLWSMFQALEFNLLQWKRNYLKTSNLTNKVISSVSPALHQYKIPCCSNCPDLKMKIVERFVEMRLKQIGSSLVIEKPKDGYQLASKEMAYRYFAQKCGSSTAKKCKVKKSGSQKNSGAKGRQGLARLIDMP